MKVGFVLQRCFVRRDFEVQCTELASWDATAAGSGSANQSPAHPSSPSIWLTTALSPYVLHLLFIFTAAQHHSLLEVPGRVVCGSYSCQRLLIRTILPTKHHFRSEHHSYSMRYTIAFAVRLGSSNCRGLYRSRKIVSVLFLVKLRSVQSLFKSFHVLPSFPLSWSGDVSEGTHPPKIDPQPIWLSRGKTKPPCSDRVTFYCSDFCLNVLGVLQNPEDSRTWLPPMLQRTRESGSSESEKPLHLSMFPEIEETAEQYENSAHAQLIYSLPMI